jgi:ATP-dependent Lon protease
MRMVIIPFQNKKDLEDVPQEILKKVKIVPVQMIDEVLKLALEKYPPPVPPETKDSTKKVKTAATSAHVRVRPGKDVTV